MAKSGDPVYGWDLIGGGYISQVFVAISSLKEDVKIVGSSEHFKEQINTHVSEIVDKVKEPVADKAAEQLKKDAIFKKDVTPKINPASGKWIDANGQDSPFFAAADKVPEFDQAITSAGTAATEAISAKQLALSAAKKANDKANDAASAANEAEAVKNETLAVQKQTLTAKKAAEDAASEAAKKAALAQSEATAAGTAASEAAEVKKQILQAKMNGEFSAIRCFISAQGSFKNGKVVGGVGGKVVLTPRKFVGGDEVSIKGSGSTIKWYKISGATEILVKSIVASGTTDISLHLSNGEMGEYFFDLL